MTPHPDGCDRCGNVRELFHYDWAEGDPEAAREWDDLAICDECNSEILRDDVPRETLRELLTRAEGAAGWLQARAERHFADARTAEDPAEHVAEFWMGNARQDAALIVQSIADSLRRTLG